jgi:hypothetical protein
VKKYAKVKNVDRNTQGWKDQSIKPSKPVRKVKPKVKTVTTKEKVLHSM